jgi:hypothetical protein
LCCATGFPIGGESQPGGWTPGSSAPPPSSGRIPDQHYAFGGDFFQYLAYQNQGDGSFNIHDFKAIQRTARRLRCGEPFGLQLPSARGDGGARWGHQVVFVDVLGSGF